MLKLKPVIEVQPLPYTSLIRQEVKNVHGETIIRRMDDISLLLFENKLLNNLSVDDIKDMIASIGGNQSDISSTISDEDIISSITSRHLQEPALLREYLEYQFADYSTSKKSFLDKVKDFFTKKSDDKIIDNV